MRRVKSLLALATIATVLTTTGCSNGDSADASSTSEPASSSNPVELTFWSWVPGVDKAVDLWNKDNPNVQVKLAVVPAGSSGTYAKMYSALQAGSGAPDVAQVEYQELPGFVLQNGLVDLTTLGMGERAKDFVDWQLKQSTFGDAIYAVPQASGPMAFFYRDDVFKGLGLTPPKTWDEFKTAAATIQKANPNQFISTFPPGNSAWFTALAWQNGAKWFGLDGDTWTINIDSPQTLQVAEYWDQMVAEKLVKTEPDFANGWYADLQQGNIVGWVSAQWGEAILAGNAPATSGLWRVAPMPQWGEGDFASANWGGSSTAVLKGTKHEQEAADFAMWLNTDPESIDLLIAGGYGWPAAQDSFKGSALDKPSEFLGGQNGNEVFKEADQAINNSWGWIPTTAATYQSLNDSFQAAAEGSGTFVDAVKKAQEQTLSDMKAKGLTVRAGE